MNSEVNSSPKKSKLRIIFLLVGIFLIASMIVLASSPGNSSSMPVEPPKIDDVMVIQLADSCAKVQKVLSNTPLTFEYGHWGFLPEYAPQNLDNLIVEIYIDGELAGKQEDTFNQIPSTALPCVDLNALNSAFAENGQWAYASLKHPGLPLGIYQVEIVYYLRERLATGQTDNEGNLIYYGPGEIQRLQKELAVE